MSKLNRRLIVVSSSFLLPRNLAWSHLKFKPDLFFAEYGNYQAVLNDDYIDDIVALIIFASDLAGNNDSTDIEDSISAILSLIETRLSKTSAPLIISFSSWAPVDVISVSRHNSINMNIRRFFLDSLERLRKKYTNLYLINIDDHLGAIGFNNAFDTRNWYFSHCRLSLTGLKTLTSLLDDLLDRFINPRKKVLVLDCDNTLWGGVIGEDEVAGIRLGSDGLGAAFSDFQNVIKEIAGTGILLAICSKNNEADVWEVFDKNPNMKIAKDEIVAYRINWKDKHINLVEMANELGLSLDSFVFWDDNPVERALVKSELPMVEVIDVPEDVMRWPNILSTLNSFRAYEVTSEDRSKLNQYKARAIFSRNIEVVGSKIDFLKSIKMKAQLIDLAPHFLERAHQLVSKTNQFNLRGIRYTLSDLKLLMSDPKSILQLGSLEDSFGDHGIVSFLIGKVVSKDVVFIDTFVMSCRVLGRHFEYWMLYSLVNKLKLRGFNYVIAEHIPSQRNQVCRYLLKDSPFVPVNDSFMEVTFSDEIVFADKSDRGLLDIQNVKFPLVEVFNND